MQALVTWWASKSSGTRIQQCQRGTDLWNSRRTRPQSKSCAHSTAAPFPTPTRFSAWTGQPSESAKLQPTVSSHLSVSYTRWGDKNCVPPIARPAKVAGLRELFAGIPLLLLRSYPTQKSFLVDCWLQKDRANLVGRHLSAMLHAPFSALTAAFQCCAADYSVFVGDLAPDVTDYALQEHFRQFFASVRSAKVTCMHF